MYVFISTCIYIYIYIYIYYIYIYIYIYMPPVMLCIHMSSQWLVYIMPLFIMFMATLSVNRIVNQSNTNKSTTLGLQSGNVPMSPANFHICDKHDKMSTQRFHYSYICQSYCNTLIIYSVYNTNRTLCCY